MRRHSLPWGMSPVPKYWKGFQTWYHQAFTNRTFEPFIKGDIRHSSWYRESIEGMQNSTIRSTKIWTQWFHYYMFKYNLLSVFPNARTISTNIGVGSRGFEYNRRERGIHFHDKHIAQPLNGTELIQVWDESYVDFKDPIVCVGYKNRIYRKIFKKDFRTT